jgi:predicted DNA-binding transcriptional regulator AlpA
LNIQSAQRLLSVSEVAQLFGYTDNTILEMLDKQRTAAPVRQQEFFSFKELAERWRCSRATVYNRLRSAGARVLDFSDKGKKGKKAIPATAVWQIENRHMKRLC